MSILVTGGTGLVGQHLIQLLAQKNLPLRALVRNPEKIQKLPNTHPLRHARIEWVEGDLLDFFSLQEAMQGMQQVYHAAAIVSFRGKDKNRLFKTNIEGTANVVNAALDAGIQKFCHVSSIAALGRNNEEGTVTEESHWVENKHNSAYAISKFRAEMEVWRGVEEGLSAVVVNPGIILGSGDWNQGSPRLIQTVDKGLPAYSPGSTGFVDVLDVVEAMVMLMDSEIVNERYILVGENLPYKSFFTQIAQQLQRPAPRFSPPRWVSEIAWRLLSLTTPFSDREPVLTREKVHTAYQHYHFSNQKIRNHLPFQFRSMEETLARVCKDYLREKMG